MNILASSTPKVCIVQELLHLLRGSSAPLVNSPRPRGHSPGCAELPQLLADKPLKSTNGGLYSDKQLQKFFSPRKSKNRANSSRGITTHHISWLWVKWKSKIVRNWEIHTISPKQFLWTWTTWRVHIPASHHMGAHEASFHFLVFHILQDRSCLGGICSPDWLLGSNLMGKESRQIEARLPGQGPVLQFLPPMHLITQTCPPLCSAYLPTRRVSLLKQ